MDTMFYCTFCDSSKHKSKRVETFDISRHVKEPDGNIKKEKASIKIPVCEECYKKLHPYTSIYMKIVIVICALVPICLLFSLIERNYFTKDFVLSIFIVVILGFLYYSFLLMLFNLAFDSFENISLMNKPYCDLPLVHFLTNNGFVQGKGNSTHSLELNEKSMLMPLEAIKEILEKKYSCTLEIK